jgi:hypothetical protein
MNIKTLREELCLIKEKNNDIKIIWYNVGETNSWSSDWDIITITLEKSYWKRIEEVYNNLLIYIREWKLLWIEMPNDWHIGYETATEWLYNHYLYWVDNNSNCAVLWADYEIIAFQYNWKERTTYIRASGCNPPWYIILNNKKQLKWKYSLSDIEDIILISKKLNLCAE